MTSSSGSPLLPGRDPALRSAIAWHMRLAEDPDDAAAQAEFDHWLTAEATHEAAWAHACRTMGLLEQGKSVAFLPTAHKPHDRGAQSKPKWRVGRFLMPAVAAAIAIAVAPQVALRWQADFITGKGGARTVELSDGSTVRMAPGSAVAVRYTPEGRGIDLLSGEAYFEVAPNPKRPFRVAAQSTHVTVLGTGFDVRIGDSGTDVAVSHGRVRVDKDGQEKPFSAILTDGQWVRLNDAKQAETGRTTPANVGSWSGDRLVAVHQPLREVVADLRRYHGGLILLTDRTMSDRLVTGSYDVRDPAKAVETVVGPLGGSVTRITPWMILISSN